MSANQIENRDRARQIRSFTGLIYGKLSPMDIDGFIAFEDKAFVFIETKFKDKDLPIGQRWALERLVDSAVTETRLSIGLIARHTIENTNCDIIVAQCIVTEYRWQRKWIKQNEIITVKQAIDRFLARNKLNYGQQET